MASVASEICPVRGVRLSCGRHAVQFKMLPQTTRRRSFRRESGSGSRSALAPKSTTPPGPVLGQRRRRPGSSSASRNAKCVGCARPSRSSGRPARIRQARAAEQSALAGRAGIAGHRDRARALRRLRPHAGVREASRAARSPGVQGNAAGLADWCPHLDPQAREGQDGASATPPARMLGRARADRWLRARLLRGPRSGLHALGLRRRRHRAAAGAALREDRAQHRHHLRQLAASEGPRRADEQDAAGPALASRTGAITFVHASAARSTSMCTSIASFPMASSSMRTAACARRDLRTAFVRWRA